MAARTTALPITGKRKRDGNHVAPRSTAVTLQIITGSYERVLHGITTRIFDEDATKPDSMTVTFTENFLFNAHSSAICCLALSPPSDPSPQQQVKRILATGSTDERINLYDISCAAPPASNIQSSSLPLLTTTSHGNRELGSLLHHSSTITTLHFPSRSKLLSSSLDNTIAITRVRDWNVLSTIRAPIPKPVGRPFGDTAAPGELPAGINYVAIHPSAKLCLSVGQGEKCMRLWNLVTGKRAGVLTFEKKVLALVGEGRWRGGEGRQVAWSTGGDMFAVSFERGAVVFGLDCQVRGVVRLPGTKTCQVKFLHLDGVDERESNVLAVSTEDGRVLFYETIPAAISTTMDSDLGDRNLTTIENSTSEAPVALLHLISYIGHLEKGSRVKDFEIFHHPFINDSKNTSTDSENPVMNNINPDLLVVTGTSSGIIRLWTLDPKKLTTASVQPNSIACGETNSIGIESNDVVQNSNRAIADRFSSQMLPNTNPNASVMIPTTTSSKQVGLLIGRYETGRRITCLTGFVMTPDGSIPKLAVNANSALNAPVNSNFAKEKAEGEDE